MRRGGRRPPFSRRRQDSGREYVVAVVGKVEKRSGAVNENIGDRRDRDHPGGAQDLIRGGDALRFQVEENSRTKEEVRLKYRYLDLRRPDMQRNLLMRSRVATLTKAVPGRGGIPGDRDAGPHRQHAGGRQGITLVPSRIHRGHIFYALPQSPAALQAAPHVRGLRRPATSSLPKCFRDGGSEGRTA